MAFKYDNLWSLLAEKKMSKEEFRIKIRASQTTVVKLGRNENVSLEVIDKICDVLCCTPNDIMEYIPKESFVKDLAVKRGEIYYIHGDDATGMRPVAIVQNTIYINHMSTVLVAPFTTRITPKQIPTNLIIESDDQNHLPINSTLQVASIFSTNKTSLNYKIGMLSNEDIARLDQACKFFLGL